MTINEEIENLIGDYWELAYEEGRLQISNGDAANEVLNKLHRAIEAECQKMPDDPMDTPLPCDVKIGAGTIRKGCKLRTLVARMNYLHEMALRSMKPHRDPALEEMRKIGDECQAMLAAAPKPEQKAGPVPCPACASGHLQTEVYCDTFGLSMNTPEQIESNMAAQKAKPVAQEPVAWWSGKWDADEDYMSERVRQEHIKVGSTTPSRYPIPLYTIAPKPEQKVEHDLYKTGDRDVPNSIKDRNGEVVLGLCKKCGRGEIELEEPCTSKQTEPVECHDCLGGEVVGEKRGVRCSRCNGTGSIEPVAQEPVEFANGERLKRGDANQLSATRGPYFDAPLYTSPQPDQSAEIERLNNALAIAEVRGVSECQRIADLEAALRQAQVALLCSKKYTDAYYEAIGTIDEVLNTNSSTD